MLWTQQQISTSPCPSNMHSGASFSVVTEELGLPSAFWPPKGNTLYCPLTYQVVHHATPTRQLRPPPASLGAKGLRTWRFGQNASVPCKQEWQLLPGCAKTYKSQSRPFPDTTDGSLQSAPCLRRLIHKRQRTACHPMSVMRTGIRVSLARRQRA